MEHSEIVNLLSERLQLSKNETKQILGLIIKKLTDKLGNNVKFTIPGFGTFGTRLRKERKSFNPHTKTFVLLPKKNTVYFKPATQLKNEMKDLEA